MLSKTLIRWLAALTLLLLAACSGQTLQEQIIGKWEGDFGGTQTRLEFTKDGKLLLSAETNNKPASLGGYYKFTDDDSIEILLQPASGEQVSGKLDLKIDGDQLTLTDIETGVIQEMQRVKE